MKPVIRRLALADMDGAARVHRASFDHALPWLTGLHTPVEDRWFYCERVFPACEVWGVVDEAVMLGVIAFRPDWVDQLYVLPQAHRRGIGTALLGVAQRAFGRLQLWTFQRNLPARRFYESKGFARSRRPVAPGTRKGSPTFATFGCVPDLGTCLRE